MEGTMQMPGYASGEELKACVMEALEREGIEVKETFHSALKQRSSYQVSFQMNEEPNHVIYLPRFTDWSDTQIALLLAYHLGEVHFKRKRDQLAEQGLTDSFKAFIQEEKPAYLHHKQAWTWVEQFFEVRGFFIDFKDEWKMKNLTKPPSLVAQMIKGTGKIVVHWVLLPLLLAYGIVAAFLMLELNGIPPFGAANLDGVDNALIVNAVLLIYVFLFAFKFVAISVKGETNEKE